MSALRYLTKVVFILCMVLLYQPAHAQILTINVRPEKFTLPEGLLENLERCTPYHIERPLRHRDTVVNTVYTIDGLQDGLCNLHITGVTNSSVEIHQDCAFPPDVAKTYAHVLQRFKDKEYSPQWDEDFISNDPDYQAAIKIMSDPKYCGFYREEIDNTKNIRDNLRTCHPAEQNELGAGIEFQRRIIGLQEDKCEYTLTIRKNDHVDHILLKGAPKAEKSDFTEHFNLSYECELDEKLAERYLLILESQVIPAEDDFDFAAIWHIAPLEELEFMKDHCKLKLK